MWQLLFLPFVVAVTCPSSTSPVLSVSIEKSHYLVCEDLRTTSGSIYYVSDTEVTVEVTRKMFHMYNEHAWLNFTKAAVLKSPEDLLGNELLKDGLGLSYEKVASAIPPIAKVAPGPGGMPNGGQHNFIGSRSTQVHITFDSHGGDPGIFGSPSADMILNTNLHQNVNLSDPNVEEGLFGGLLPTNIYVFPATNGSFYWEYAAVPYLNPGHNREQPAAFRYMKVDTTSQPPKAVEFYYFDTYVYSAGALNPHADFFYIKLFELNALWAKTWEDEGIMKVELPQQRDPDGLLLSQQAIHGLVKDMIVRQDYFWPKYGVFPGYVVNNENGFQDTFASSLTAALEWNCIPYATGVLDNWLENYVRANGSISYRGIEMNMEARTLTLIAMYYQYTGGDPHNLVIKYYDQKILGIIQLLERKRMNSLKYPKNDPRYGQPIGNDEADAWYTQGTSEKPYISISSEMWRAYRDLGHTLKTVGQRHNRSDISNMGTHLILTSKSLLTNFHNSLQLNRVKTGNARTPYCYPYAADSKQCAELKHQTTVRDSEPWRTYPQAFYSGAVPQEVVETMVLWNRYNNNSMRCGLMSGTGGDCCGEEIMAFTAHGWGFGMLQFDMREEYLLQWFSLSNHAYTRGTWMAPESASIDRLAGAVWFAPPSSTTVTVNLKWVLVYEEPMNHTLWLAKATPHRWLSEGDTIVVNSATTYYGKISYTMQSLLSKKLVKVFVSFSDPLDCSSTTWKMGPHGCPSGGLMIRVSVPCALDPSPCAITKVMIGGVEWPNFDAKRELLIIPAKDLSAELQLGLGDVEVYFS